MNRFFSDSVKLEVIKQNLERNGGNICCEICGVKLSSIKECHFDHIFPYAKGGKSDAKNCQILCVNCNLRKNDKELQDFMLEEQAKRFLFEEKSNIQAPSLSEPSAEKEEMTKEHFDKEIRRFLDIKGDIHKVDFSREYNGLPSIHYMRKFYGDLSSLKKVFHIDDLSLNWNRETIKEALDQYIEKHGDIFQKNLTKANRLPSLPCILSYYPEYNNFTDIKRDLCQLKVREKWTVETAIEAGKDYVKKNGKITQTKLGINNHLPSVNVINNLFGSLSSYQKAVGAEVTYKKDLITDEVIKIAVEQYLKDNDRVIENTRDFFARFPYSISTIQKRYGSLASFCDKYDIIIINSKKSKFTKQEVDEAIKQWVKAGKPIPRSKDLTKCGLPSMSVILKYYEDWKKPFELYRHMNNRING